MPRYVMPGYNNFPRLLNQPVRIHMAGWTSDTYALQKHGWQISVNESPKFRSLQIAVKHPVLKLYAITNRIEHSVIEDFQLTFNGNNLELNIEHLACEIRVHNYATTDDFSNFRPVDATPRYEMQDTTVQRTLDDFKIFRALPKEKEIIIKPESVGELLDKIRSMQDPFQAEFREKKRKQLRKFEREVNDYDLGTNIVAQVATLV